MGMCCAACSRIFLTLISIFNVIIGVGLVALSIWLRADERVEYALRNALADRAPNPYEMYELKQQIRFAAIYIFWVTIAFGVGLFTIGFVGTCGACRVSRTANAVYATLLVLLFAGEVLAVLFVAFYRHKAGEWVARYLAVGAQFNLSDSQIVNQRFNCCGDGTSNSYNLVCQGTFQPSCAAVIGGLLGNVMSIGGAVLLSLMGLQLATLLFSCVLFVNHKYRTLHESSS